MIKFIVKPESSNKYDAFAVSIFFKENKKGYFPKTKDETIARLMDFGKQFFAVLTHKELEGNWWRLHIKIYLKD